MINIKVMNIFLSSRWFVATKPLLELVFVYLI
jgi:hypothetical protein